MNAWLTALVISFIVFLGVVLILLINRHYRQERLVESLCSLLNAQTELVKDFRPFVKVSVQEKRDSYVERHSK